MKAAPKRRWILSLGALFVASWLFPSPHPAQAAGEFEKFDVESAAAQLSTADAGAHPDVTVSLTVTQNPAIELAGDKKPYAALRDVVVTLPPGLIGNLNAVDTCSNAEFISGTSTSKAGCPFSSQVGISDADTWGGEPGKTSISPIFLLENSDDDTVATLGFIVVSVPVFIDVRLRSDSDYGVTAEVRNLSAAAFVITETTTLWGVPADPSHDTLRLTPKEVGEQQDESPPRSAGHPLAPFLSNPTACGQPLEVTVAADSYQEPGRFHSAAAPLGEITNCEGLDFKPDLDLQPTNREAAAPSGADAALSIPQHESYDEKITSSLRNSVIRLPRGLALSSPAADGLAACSAAEVGYQVSPPRAANCPDAAKIATATIDSPSLERPIEGALYQRTPEKGNLFRAWLVADELGVHVKIPGEFKLDPDTGQVTSLFLETPQVPLRELHLHFKGGARGVLATPRRCGTYATTYSFTPWSGNPNVDGTSEMVFDRNCGAGGFSPKLAAGTVNPLAGAFSPLVTVLTQASGEQNLSRLSVTMPPGVLAKLKGVALCPDSVASTGNCPAGSRVGRTDVASGFGPSPLWLPQPGKAPTAVYLAAPYKSAPYSLVVTTPAQAGPFDLGNVVVRVALQVDQTTAQATAVSDPLPQLIEGIPVAYREVRLALDRPEFALNPTNCSTMQVTGAATSIEGSNANLTSRFQVGGCEALKFEPKLALTLRGATERAGDPALSAVLTMPAGGANIATSRVSLPRFEAIDNAHVNNPCTRVQFNAHACPPKSILGHASATSPLLDEPLSGPVYFRSNGGERQLPDIVADLNGQIHVVVVGFIDSKHRRIRNTFATVPDAPITKFKLNLFGGHRGLLENNRDICEFPGRALIQFKGQNGKIATSRPEVRVPSCGEHHRGR